MDPTHSWNTCVCHRDEHMNCSKCGTELQQGWILCPVCGKKLTGASKKKRGNGQGTITKLPGKRKNAYWARLPADYSGKTTERISVGCFPTYKAAAEAIAKAMYAPPTAWSDHRIDFARCMVSGTALGTCGK